MTLAMEYMIDGPLKAEGTFILFGVFCFLGTIFVAIFVRETKGLSDADMKLLYAPQNKVISDKQIA